MHFIGQSAKLLRVGVLSSVCCVCAHACGVCLTCNICWDIPIIKAGLSTSNVSCRGITLEKEGQQGNRTSCVQSTLLLEEAIMHGAKPY